MAMIGLKTFVGAVAGIAMVLVVGAAGAADAPARGEGMRAGLKIDYYYGDFGHVDKVLEYVASNDSIPGEPMPNLDFRGGEGKPVFNQKHKNYVAAIITGFINFPSAGTHMIKVRSNDGVRIAIAGLTVFEDPKPHPDRTSDPVPVKVSEAGWLPIEIVYFERKGSWSLELTWQQDGDFSAIPASHFAH
ncbi:MAG: PA14 domain-containing protein [Alphaproteobacteria bacterium]|nr:PA14 domain-containing protein [Alphaproteobacteria bacterium]